jgi:hypothetical protein
MIPLICGRNITYVRYDNENLSLPRYLCFNCSRDDVTVLVTHSHIHLLPPHRGGVHEGQVSQISHTHLKGAGNGGSRQCKYVRATRYCLCI